MAGHRSYGGRLLRRGLRIVDARSTALVDLETREVISRLGSHSGRLELDGSGSAMSNANWGDMSWYA